jgi:hypothetical protein
MTTKHTPGPWIFDESEDEDECFDVKHVGYFVATAHGGFTDPLKAISNARLIAAAPELLAACEVALHMLRDRKLDGGQVGASLEIAIAKATGG